MSYLGGGENPPPTVRVLQSPSLSRDARLAQNRQAVPPPTVRVMQTPYLSRLAQNRQAVPPPRGREVTPEERYNAWNVEYDAETQRKAARQEALLNAYNKDRDARTHMLRLDSALKIHDDEKNRRYRALGIRPGREREPYCDKGYTWWKPVGCIPNDVWNNHKEFRSRTPNVNNINWYGGRRSLSRSRRRNKTRKVSSRRRSRNTRRRSGRSSRSRNRW